MKKVIVAAACGIWMSAAVAGSCWVKSEANPVFGNERLGTCFDANVVKEGGKYVMYFSWRPRKAIAKVSSTDGIHWDEEPVVCLDANEVKLPWASDINRSCTVFKDGVYHLWFTGQKKGASKIGYATSRDGVHFEPRREYVMEPEHEYEKLSVMNPFVLWDAGRKVWRMWYAAGETYEPNVICYAESTDGVAWQKYKDNPIFTHGDRLAWDRDRVGACEVVPADGKYYMFYIGYSDVDTARIGYAVSADGITGWRRADENPIIAPDVCTWDSSATYKPSVVKEGASWKLWYNGRNGRPEYIGMAELKEQPPPAGEALQNLARTYVQRFNAKDDECYTNAFSNAQAEKFIIENVPYFACPDKDIERTYYFRWWTFRKHLKQVNGRWLLSEFLPNVPWALKDNMIVCVAGHHLREGRWLRESKFMEDYARYWLQAAEEKHRAQYSSWLFTGAQGVAEVSGNDRFAEELLPFAVRNYEGWERGYMKGHSPMGGDGKGGFKSIDNYEGTEMSLGGDGYKPLLASAMWSEAMTIARIAERTGKKELAQTYRAKAATNYASLVEQCWNKELKFFTTNKNGVRELHGYAPWYFGLPCEGMKMDWPLMVDTNAFGAVYGMSFVERRAKGFALAYTGHECQWNGPSWPLATTVALTAYINYLHSLAPTAPERAQSVFPFLLWQYAAQHKRTKPFKGDDWTVVPWIDENLNPDTNDWISRTIILNTPKMRAMFPRERGKDYNHSAYCDLVITGIAGFVPQGEEGFKVDPLAPAAWDYWTLDHLRYRGHEISISFTRAVGLTVTIDGKPSLPTNNIYHL